MLFKAKYLLVFISFFACADICGQTTKTCAANHGIHALQPQTISDADNGTEVVEPFDGTFQFIFTKGVKQAFTTDVLKTIDDSREEDEEVTITLSPFCKVNILSRKQIAASGFVPFSKSYVFEN